MTKQQIKEKARKLQIWAVDAEGLVYEEGLPLSEYSGRLGDFDSLIDTLIDQVWDAAQGEIQEKLAHDQHKPYVITVCSKCGDAKKMIV